MIDIEEKAKELRPPTCHGRWMSEEYEPGLVSVIVPTYNRAQMITEAMDSVWAQTYRPIELIVVDDGSTDNTAEMIGEWDSKHQGDPRFRLRYFRQENRGAPAARNRGAAQSCGEYVLWHDSDDLMFEDRVGAAVEKLVTTDADACACGYKIEGDIVEYGSDPGDDVVKGYFPERFSCMSIIWLYKRDFIARRHPWREYLVRWQDHFFYHDWAMSLPEPKIAGVPSPLILIRKPGGRLTDLHHSRADFKGRLRYLEEKSAELGKNQDKKNAPVIEKFIAEQALNAAVYTRKKYPELYRHFLQIWKNHGKNAVWGRTGAHRLIFRIGGVWACSLLADWRRNAQKHKTVKSFLNL